MSETLLKGRYRLVAQQGSGGMAVIYKAIDQELGRTVAIKILRPSLTKDAEFLKRFKNEARNVANLNHPNIVTVHDVGSDGNTHYIVMEFIDGSDLKKLIRKDGALGVDLAVDLSIQMAAGLGFAHRAGLVHADVKPQNVLLTSNMQVKVTDFGIAQAFSDTTSNERQDVVWGSPHYFAPEQARGEKPTPASDVYSMGIVMFELLTGQLPYMGTNQQELALAHIRDEIPHVRDFAPHVPDELDRVVYKLMSKEPSQRYRMADQLGHILAEYRKRGQQYTAVNPRVIQQQQPPQQPAPARPEDAPYQPPQQQAQQPIPPAPVAPRPLYQEPPKQAEPTQRFSAVPEAPAQGARQSAVPSPMATPPPQQGAYPSAAGTGAMPPYNTAAMRGYEAEGQGGLDAVTIILAFLAGIAVLCLIPLYILVWMAYF